MRRPNNNNSVSNEKRFIKTKSHGLLLYLIVRALDHWQYVHLSLQISYVFIVFFLVCKT